MNSTKITAEAIRAMKARGGKIAALTAYDFPMTKLLDEAGIPLILVGDSLGMVVLGYPDRYARRHPVLLDGQMKESQLCRFR